MKDQPPPILDSAKVLKYAIVNRSVEFTGRLCLFTGGKRLGKVPKLAICQNYKAKDFLLFFCNSKWKVLGVAGYKSIKETKERAENYYKGITKRWVTVAKPNVFKNWPGDLGPICSFCGKTMFEAVIQMFRGKNAYVCNQCVTKFNRIIETNKDEA